MSDIKSAGNNYTTFSFTSIQLGEKCIYDQHDHLSCMHSLGSSGIQPDVRSSYRSCRCQSLSCCRGQTWGKEIKNTFVQVVILAIIALTVRGGGGGQ